MRCQRITCCWCGNTQPGKTSRPARGLCLDRQSCLNRRRILNFLKILSYQTTQIHQMTLSYQTSQIHQMTLSYQMSQIHQVSQIYCRHPTRSRSFQRLCAMTQIAQARCYWSDWS
jgi:hypothetical protein